MKDLLQSDKTLAGGLADLATSASFELVESIHQPEKYLELPMLREFLHTAAAMRLKYPERMRRLDARFAELRHSNLVRLETDLAEILPQSARVSPIKTLETGAKEKLQQSRSELHQAAETLYKIEAKYFESLRKYEEEHCI